MTLFLPLASTLLIASLLGAFSIYSPPIWVEKYEGNWKKLNIYSSLIAAAIAVLSALMWFPMPTLPLTAIAASTASLAFASCQSVLTDHKLRLVDRRMLYLAMLPPLILHGLILKDVKLEFTMWVIVMLVFASLIFLPRLMGASDGRALLLIAIAAYPPLGLRAFTWGFAGFIILLLLYAAITLDKKEHSKTFRSFFKELVTVKSIPAVPLLLIPYVLLLPLVRLLGT